MTITKCLIKFCFFPANNIFRQSSRLVHVGLPSFHIIRSTHHKFTESRTVSIIKRQLNVMCNTRRNVRVSSIQLCVLSEHYDTTLWFHLRVKILSNIYKPGIGELFFTIIDFYVINYNRNNTTKRDIGVIAQCIE